MCFIPSPFRRGVSSQPFSAIPLFLSTSDRASSPLVSRTLANAPPSTQPNPADLRHICIYRAAEVRNEIANICGGSDTNTDDEDEHDEAQRAVAAFEEVCGPLTASTSTRESQPPNNDPTCLSPLLTIGPAVTDEDVEHLGIFGLMLSTRSNYLDYLCRLVDDYGRCLDYCGADVQYERDHHGAIDYRDRDTDNNGGHDGRAYGGGGGGGG